MDIIGDRKIQKLRLSREKHVERLFPKVQQEACQTLLTNQPLQVEQKLKGEKEEMMES